MERPSNKNAGERRRDLIVLLALTAAARRGVVVASSNLGKLAEIRSILADLELDLRGLDEFPAVVLPEELSRQEAAQVEHELTRITRMVAKWK